jgi:hypothetical protein
LLATPDIGRGWVDSQQRGSTTDSPAAS